MNVYTGIDLGARRGPVIMGGALLLISCIASPLSTTQEPAHVYTYITSRRRVLWYHQTVWTGSSYIGVSVVLSAWFHEAVVRMFAQLHYFDTGRHVLGAAMARLKAAVRHS